MKKMMAFEFNEQFQEAFEALEHTQDTIFITGSAGTGKSTFLEYFKTHTSKKIAVLAPTGVAALNIKGQTIHSFFKFKPNITPDTVKKIHSGLYKKLDAIIIDEISMVRADLLDCIDVFMRLHGPDPKRAFGGVQMIWIGDLYQLPPVVTYEERDLFRTQYRSPYFFDARVCDLLTIKLIEFEKIYRQKDPTFIEILAAIRENKVFSSHLTTLNQRHDPNFTIKQNSVHIYVTTTNAKANEVNQQQMQLLRQKEYVSYGSISGNFDKSLLPTESALSCKVGAQVMLLNNDTEGRWVNGSVGKITKIKEYDNGMMDVEIKLSDGDKVVVEPFTWEMYQYVQDTEGNLSQEVSGSFSQLPFKLAWAITIHKSQGKTFDHVILDIDKGTFAHGQLYVGLSRCRTLEGLVLKKKIERRHIIMDRRVIEFFNILKQP